MEQEKEHKIMLCLQGTTIRDIVKQVNKLEIQREDVVSMFALGGYIYLAYYG